MDMYTLLNVDRRASTEVIQAAFKALSVKHHPDHGGDNKLYEQLIEARNTLTDASKRSKYDQDLARKAKSTGKTIIGPYEVVKFIAEGAMGRTYIVRHTLTKKLACLKACLSVGSEYEEIMLNEASAIWDIRHYAFPAVRDVLKLEDGAIAIAMSYVPGPTLEQCVQHIGAVEPEHSAWILERLLAGLNYLHANGVIHGDIKPQNIIIQPDRHSAVLIDFGLAMIKPTGKDHNVGFTNHFSPPEQIATERKPLIPETDLYSLGMTMLYVLSGKRITRIDQLPRNVPTAFRNFIAKLIVPDINRRPNWQKTDLLEEVANMRIASFGTRNTRGKVFPCVPFDVLT
jgi:serine/threonine protein kinase